jgi:hypothetical protein
MTRSHTPGPISSFRRACPICPKIAKNGHTWFNTDTSARELIAAAGCDQTEAANATLAGGQRCLDAAVNNGTNYAFETTLGDRKVREGLVRLGNARCAYLVLRLVVAGVAPCPRQGSRGCGRAKPLVEAALSLSGRRRVGSLGWPHRK